MKQKIDSKFFIIYTVLEAISFIFSVSLFIYAIINIFQNKSMNNEFFEITYFGIHLIIHFMALALMFKAIKQESFAIKPLTHDRYATSVRSNKAVVIASVLATLFTLTLIYGILIYINVGIYDFHFTTTLKLVLISVSVFMILSMSAFIIYPFKYK